MSRAKLARSSLPPPDKLRAEQRSQRRQIQRSKQHPPPPRDPPATSKNRAEKLARKRLLAQRRRAAEALPRPFGCLASTAGFGRVGWRKALSEGPWPHLVITGIFVLPTIMAWAPNGPEGPRSLPVAIALTLVALVPVVRYLRQVWQASRKKVPAQLSADANKVLIDWKDGPMLAVPMATITGAEAALGTPVVYLRGTTIPGGGSGATVVIEREGSAPVHVETTWTVAQQLVAAIEVARGDLAGGRASHPKSRVDKAVEEPAEIPPATAPEPLPPNEAALAALDREGRPLTAWREALRAAFADVGYRRTPPLPPDELLQVVTDPRVSAERRIGAALALSLRADDDLRSRLRVASTGLESASLRVAVERAAEGELEDESLEEALSDETRA